MYVHVLYSYSYLLLMNVSIYSYSDIKYDIIVSQQEKTESI